MHCVPTDPPTTRCRPWRPRGDWSGSNRRSCRIAVVHPVVPSLFGLGVRSSMKLASRSHAPNSMVSIVDLVDSVAEATTSGPPHTYWRRSGSRACINTDMFPELTSPYAASRAVERPPVGWNCDIQRGTQELVGIQAFVCRRASRCRSRRRSSVFECTTSLFVHLPASPRAD